MPIPSLPEELVVHIFECLYSILSTGPYSARLEDPDGHALVFSRVMLVSRAWHRLALPFFHRHFSAATVASDPAAAQRLAESGMIRSARYQGCHRLDLKQTTWLFARICAMLERLVVELHWDAASALSEVKMPNLRELRVESKADLYFVSLPPLVSPQLEDFELRFSATARCHLLNGLYPEQRTPIKDLGNLKRVCLDLLSARLEDKELFSALVAPSFLRGRKLVDINIGLDHELNQYEYGFDDLFPDTLPLVESFRCVGNAINCSSPRLFEAFPSLMHLDISVPHAVPALDALPPTLRTLAFSRVRLSRFPDLVETLLAALMAGHLGGIRTCTVEVLDDVAEADVLASLAPHKARLAHAFANSTVHLIAPFLVDFLPDEAFAAVPRPRRPSSSSDVVAASPAPIARYPLSAEPLLDSDYGLPVDVPPLPGDWASSSSESEGESDYANEANWDWEAEDGELFRGCWSEGKKIDRDLDAASSAALAPILSRFKTAAERDTAAEF
ncbi:hypothetical protein JCM10207_003318, partial [Rhodosporidiobolus poonsookiae]